MIILRLSAQMGNQMFMYAATYALARDLNEKLAVFKLDYTLIYTMHRGWNFFLDDLKLDDFYRYRGVPVGLYAETLRYTLQKFMKNKDVRQPDYGKGGVDYIQEGEHSYHPIRIDAKKKRHLLKGFFQSPKYFEKYKDDIIRQFQPDFKLSDETEYAISLIEKSEYPVSIHIRRGDYTQIGCCLPLEYYEVAVQEIYRKHTDPTFYIFSDDIEWVKENLKLTSQNVYFVSHERKVQPFEDIWAMSRCKANIIANSTFSWWGGYLNRSNDKVVIAPNSIKGLNKDIVPDGWITLAY